MYTTVRVRKGTLNKLSLIVGELSVRLGRKVTYDEAINYLINIYKSKRSRRALDNSTIKLIKLIKKPFPGAGPEDFREYDYDDLGE
ncbi:MAG: hypothetical protein Q6363_009000 [Candidatus Njordarchaeota archaeon]